MKVIKITTGCAPLRLTVCKLLRHNEHMFLNVVLISCVDLTETSILPRHEILLNTKNFLSTYD
jgi:hypothetical protein